MAELLLLFTLGFIIAFGIDEIRNKVDDLAKANCAAKP